MSIRLRLLSILCLLLAVFGGALVALQHEEKEHVARVIETVRNDGRMQLNRWADIIALPVRQFVQDHANWEETRTVFAAFEPGWARKNFDDNLATYGLDAIWLLRRDGTALYTAKRDTQVALPALPAAAELAALAEHSRLEFFAMSASGLWQISGAPVGDGGWLIAARQWNEGVLSRLAEMSESSVTLLDSDKINEPDSLQHVTLSRALRDVKGNPVKWLRMRQAVPDLTGSIEWDGYVMGLFVAFGMLLVVALALSVQRWVLGPLNAIGASLAKHDTAPIAPLLRRRDEFQHVAGLVESSFADHRALEHEITERKHAESALRTSEENLRHSIEVRARLARDLHDTVIQSIYAAGLGLESVRAQMSEDPFGAEGRIRHCMTALNDTIRQVRSYINDLEPHATEQRQPFAHAVRALASTMQALWPVEIILRLDEATAQHLGDAREVHALQIVRECISNALRHGAATRIEISLSSENNDVVLEVRDNGRGFDPAQHAGNGGHGLLNLTSRASEMGGAIRIHSAPGCGATVTLRLPLPAPRVV